MKHFATITLALFLLICILFVECRDAEGLSFTQVALQDTRLMNSQTPLAVDSGNSFFEVGGEVYVLTTDDPEVVFRYNRNTSQWERVALFH